MINVMEHPDLQNSPEFINEKQLADIILWLIKVKKIKIAVLRGAYFRKKNKGLVYLFFSQTPYAGEPLGICESLRVRFKNYGVFRKTLKTVLDNARWQWGFYDNLHPEIIDMDIQIAPLPVAQTVWP